ncbi:MAG: helicase HerA-like domain-containing protein, partial [Gemmatimonadota bacterium]
MGRKPGDLYLGQVLDQNTSEPTDAQLQLPSHRLTTHGVIVGMTGSGKTGLGVVLLEEILSAGIPALILDPKGDMGNLLLNFPSFDPREFQPWVDEGEARRKGISTSELAESTATLWKEGTARSGIDSREMEELKGKVDFRILTPGSTAGIPLNIVGDLSPPKLSWDEGGETVRDEIEGLVSGILVMADLDADPLTSKEHILLSNLVELAWRNGQSLDLPTLIGQIQQPPLRRLGVFDLDTFFPEKERTKLAMRLNGLVASPSFAEWIQGEPLDMEGLLRAPDGRPRASIVYLSHLSESERVFVVTLLLSKLVTWMRQQPGTSELRAFVYADEVMGLAPPTAEPPSKRPILTLFKQARAHGVGVVLATQNPIDLDYKLMSNAGTWMVGRLQTERDKARIIEALRSASGEVDVGAWDARISGLGKRQFVLKTARSPQPELFTTRWAMSYLRGPFTRTELLRLKPGFSGGTDAVGQGAAADSAAPTQTGSPPPSGAGAPTHSAAGSASTRQPAQATLAPDESPVPPTVASGIPVRFLDPAAPWGKDVGVAHGGRRLEAGLAARVRVLFDDQKGDLRHEEEWEAVFFPLGARFEAESAHVVDHDPRDFRDEPQGEVVYALPEPALDKGEFFRSSEKAIEEHLYRELSLTLFRNSSLGLYSRVGESEEAFGKRCLEAAEERADADAEKLRNRYESKLKTAQGRASQAERRVRELEVDTGQRRQQELIAGAGEVLSMFLGGRRRTRSLSGISSRRSQTVRTKERLRSAEEKLEDYQETILELEEELSTELQEIWAKWKTTAEELDAFEVGLEKTDIHLDDL